MGPFLAALGPFWEHFGRAFCVPERARSPKVRQEAPPPKFPHPFRSLFGVKNDKKSFPEAPQPESLKMCRKCVPTGCDCEGLDPAKVWEGCPKSRVSKFLKKLIFVTVLGPLLGSFWAPWADLWPPFPNFFPHETSSRKITKNTTQFGTPSACKPG